MYEYDNAGNITAKKKYAFTTGTLGAVQTTYTYSYNDSSWGDLLTSYDSTTIVYDEIGNPVRIGNYNAANDVWWGGYDLTWVGRQLMSYTAFYRYDADEELSYRTPVTFTYNADGIRTSKTVNGVELFLIYLQDVPLSIFKNAPRLLACTCTNEKKPGNGPASFPFLTKNAYCFCATIRNIKKRENMRNKIRFQEL